MAAIRFVGKSICGCVLLGFGGIRSRESGAGVNCLEIRD
jgi:hypothetical protein